MPYRLADFTKNRLSVNRQLFPSLPGPVWLRLGQLQYRGLDRNRDLFRDAGIDEEDGLRRWRLTYDLITRPSSVMTVLRRCEEW